MTDTAGRIADGWILLSLKIFQLLHSKTKRVWQMIATRNHLPASCAHLCCCAMPKVACDAFVWAGGKFASGGHRFRALQSLGRILVEYTCREAPENGKVPCGAKEAGGANPDPAWRPGLTGRGHGRAPEGGPTRRLSLIELAMETGTARLARLVFRRSGGLSSRPGAGCGRDFAGTFPATTYFPRAEPGRRTPFLSPHHSTLRRSRETGTEHLSQLDFPFSFAQMFGSLDPRTRRKIKMKKSLFSPELLTKPVPLPQHKAGRQRKEAGNFIGRPGPPTGPFGRQVNRGPHPAGAPCGVAFARLVRGAVPGGPRTFERGPGLRDGGSVGMKRPRRESGEKRGWGSRRCPQRAPFFNDRGLSVGQLCRIR